MHRRRSHRSRSPRGNAQALHRSRSRIDRYEDHVSSAEDETRYTPGNFGYQTSGWHSPYSVNHDTVPTRSDDSVLGNGNYHDPVPNPEWPTSSIGDHDGTLGSNYYYSSVYVLHAWGAFDTNKALIATLMIQLGTTRRLRTKTTHMMAINTQQLGPR